MVQTVATDYDTVWDAGASGGNGQLAAALTLLSTELNGLAIAALALSSAGGSSGVFTNANTLQAILGVPFLILGGAVEVPATRPTVSLWFLESPDGSTFESPAAAPARFPDATFQFTTRSYVSGEPVIAQGRSCRLPALNFKVLAQNNLGVELPPSTVIKIALTAQHVN